MATATATIMFTDLVGSTALMSRVGEVSADVLRREHFEILRRPIGERGGTEVKNLGDGLMVAFDSSADAIDAAIELQQALWRRNRRAEEALEIRIGLAVGDVEVEDGDRFGAPVVQAARLCAVAGTGEILCTELVRMLAGTRTVAEFEPVGALELKGLDEPVPAARVRWSPPDEDHSPGAGGAALPARLTMAIAPEFVGREDEFDRLSERWKAAAEGERQVVLVGGEPGIGKTTLAARLASAVQEQGGLVTYGRSDEDLGIPYQPWVEALNHLVGALPAEILDAHLAERGAHLGRLVPDLLRRATVEVPVGDREGERFVLFGCAVDLLERASADRPVLVVLDDLHWADRQSLQLLRHLVTCGRPLRVLVVGTFRDSDVSSGDPMSELLAALHREQGTDRIAMRGLSDVDVQGLLEHLAGHGLDERGLALRDAVIAETAGNPFFVREILRHLAESGAIYRDASGRWVGDVDVRDVGLPVSVTEVVGRRVATLGDDAVRLLSLASVIGRDFDVPLLALAAGVDEDEAVNRCDDAVAAAILTSTDVLDRYSFAHALIERTLYEGLSRSRRARAHRSVAESLERLTGSDPGARAGELAHHWSEAVQADDPGRALRYARIAGERALAQLAPDDAVHWFVRAVDLLADGDDAQLRAELLVGLGEAQRQIGDPDHRRTLAEAADLAELTGDGALLATAALASCRSWASNTGAVDADLVSLLRRALAGLDPQDRRHRARLLVALAIDQSFGDDLAECHRLGAEAVEVARSCDDPRTLALVLVRNSVANRDPYELPARRDRLAEAMRLIATLDDPVLEYDGADQARLLSLEAGDLVVMRRFAEQAAAAGARAPIATVLWCQTFHQVWAEVLDGDLGRAEQTAEAALAIGLESGQPDALTIYGAGVAGIRFHSGRLGELRPAIEDAAREHPALGYGAVIVLLDALEGRVDEAWAGLDAAAAEGFALRRDQATTTVLQSWASAAAGIRHPSMPAIRDLLLPLRERICTSYVSVLPAISYGLGRLEHAIGDLDAAERSFALADEIHRRMESPLLVLYSDVGRASLLVDRARPGDHDEARALAEGVLAASVAGGYGYLEADARAVLERLVAAS